MQTFPLEDLQASRNDEPLQAKMRREVGATKRANPRITCRECGSSANLVWFFFSSPSRSWQTRSGGAGIVAFCDVHERQVAFLAHAR